MSLTGLLESLRAKVRNLQEPTPQQLKHILLGITRGCPNLSPEEKSKLWWELEKVLFARFTVTKVPTESCSQQVVYELFYNVFPKAQYVPLDGSFRVTTLPAMEEIVKTEITHRISYISCLWDCENYARLLQSLVALHYYINSVAEVHGFPPNHGFNMVVVRIPGGPLELRFVEPQQARFWTLEQNARGENPFNRPFDVDIYFI